MDLTFNSSLANNYHSTSQIVRVLTENWALNNLFCPRCGNANVLHFENNKPVADFYCPVCASEYELKSKNGNIHKKITDGAYDTMIQRITSNNNPDLFCLSYTKDRRGVNNLIFIPKHFFTPEIIEKRKPLKDTARRAGWVGCNILVDKIPAQGKIAIIQNEAQIKIQDILYKVKKSELLRVSDITIRGWLFDVLNCINAIPTTTFSLNDIYQFKKILSIKHPTNNFIEAKIRQQLQLLRDKCFIKFLGHGKYEKLGEFI